jgi:hypothetical protein
MPTKKPVVKKPNRVTANDYLNRSAKLLERTMKGKPKSFAQAQAKQRAFAKTKYGTSRIGFLFRLREKGETPYSLAVRFNSLGRESRRWIIEAMELSRASMVHNPDYTVNLANQAVRAVFISNLRKLFGEIDAIRK